MPLPDPSNDLYSTASAIDRERSRRTAGVAQSIGDVGALLEPTEGERARQADAIKMRRALAPAERDAHVGRLKDIAAIRRNMGLPTNTDEQIAATSGAATYGDLEPVQKDWERLVGEYGAERRMRPPAGPKPITPAEEIRAEEAAARTNLAANARDDKGHQGNVIPVDVAVATADRLAARNPKRYAATKESSEWMREAAALAKKGGGDPSIAKIRIARKYLADPKKAALLDADPFARQYLQEIVRFEKQATGTPSSGPFPSLGWGTPAVPAAALPE